MERPKNIVLNSRLAIIVIVLFHLVGLVGLSVPAIRPLFLQIVPWHILLMLAVVVAGHHHINLKFTAFVLMICLLGYCLEWLGVHKYWIFGDYNYGETLGLKLFDIPLLIGVNWFLLIYAAGVTMQLSRLKNTTLRVVAGAALLVLLDILIEPVAIRFDYWHWELNLIPLKNYMCWFMVSAAMLYLFEWFRFKKQSIAAPVLLITEIVFFGVLNLVIL